jgi:hypothetical protein
LTAAAVHLMYFLLPEGFLYFIKNKLALFGLFDGYFVLLLLLSKVLGTKEVFRIDTGFRCS